MRKILMGVSALLLLQTAPVFASDIDLNVILAGEIHPGVYGRVELGNAPRPRVVYERPRVIVTERRYVRAEPIYLHVPPEHAHHWDRHCRAYNACGRPVYFVRSEEYEPAYQRRERDRRRHEEYEHRHDHDHDNRHH